MSEIHKKKFSLGRLLLIILLASTSFVLIIRHFLRGKNVALLNPKGLIAQEQYNLLVYTVTILLIFAIPTLFIFFFIAWKYRESNTDKVLTTKAKYGRFQVLGLWLIPSVFMFILATAMLPATQKLDPRKLVAADAKPLKIQVVSMRWKWLFIYPEQQIATVNYIQFPVNTPIQFELTADEAPMSSFWIPNLGGQLYTMTGMVNELNLMADTPGDYAGSSAEINGAGFAGMRFTARASTAEDFDKWIKEAKMSSDILNDDAYASLLKPSKNNPVALYSAFEPNLYNKVVMKYLGSHEESGHH